MKDASNFGEVALLLLETILEVKEILLHSISIFRFMNSYYDTNYHSVEMYEFKILL